MPIFDHDGTTAYSTGKLHDHDGTSAHQTGKIYDSDGTVSYLIYTAEEAKRNLSAGCFNHYEYHSTASGTSSASWDLSGFTSVSFAWSLRTDMSWPNGNGVGSTTRVYLKLADGTNIPVGSKSGGLFTAGAAYEASGIKTVSLTGYTDEQLKSVKLYITLGDMQSGVPISGSDRHNASASITNAIAS